MQARNIIVKPDTLIDDTDRKIITATQSGLPLVRDPYRVVAEQIGIDTHELLKRINHLQQCGIIRRIGIIPNHYKLGYRANGMSVWNVPDTLVQQLGHDIGKLDFVSHCYRRPRFLPEWPYNLFAMVHGQDRDEVMHKVALIDQLLGENNQGHDVLFSRRILKKTGLRLKE